MNENKGYKVILSNSAWLIGESILTMLISLIVGVISARYLGPSNYGLINRFLPYITLANSICTFGMQSIIVREISKDHSKENVGKVLGSTIVLRMVLSLLSIITINVYAYYVSLEEEPILFIVSILQSISLIFNSYEIVTYYFHAELKSKYLAIATTITSVLIGGWKIALLINHASVVFFALSTTLQAIFMSVFCWLFFLKDFQSRLTYSSDTLKYITKDSYHLLLTSIGIAIYGQVDKIMIGSQLGNSQLGYYSAAYTIATMWYFLPQALANSLRSKVFEKTDDKVSYDNLSRLLFMIIVVLGIFAGLAFTVLGNLIIKILYGEEYLTATSTLCILGWVGLFANLGTAKSIWLVGRNLHQYTKWFTLFGAIINIVLNFFLIRIIGINGAAIATVISQGCVQFVFPLIFKDTREAVYHMVYCFSSTSLLQGYFREILQKRPKRK